MRRRKYLRLALVLLPAAAAVWWLTPPRPRAVLTEGSDLLRLSPDGRWLATRQGGRVTIWDVATGRAAGELGGDLDLPRWDSAFSSDGRWLAACGDGLLKVWELPAGREHVEVRVSADKYFHASPAFSPDGRWLAFRAAGPDRTRHEVRVWDVEPACERAALPGPRVNQLLFSPDGKTLVFETSEPVPGQPPRGTLRLWDADTGRERPALDEQPAPLRVLAFSPDGRTLAAAERQRGQWTGPHEIKLWDLATGRALGPWLVPRGVWGLRYTADGSRLLARAHAAAGANPMTDADSELFLIDPHAPPGDVARVSSVSKISPQGDLAAHVRTSPDDASVILELPSQRWRAELHPRPSEGVLASRDFAPDGKLFVIVAASSEPTPPPSTLEWLGGLFGLKRAPPSLPPLRPAELRLYETDTGRLYASVPVIAGTEAWFTADGRTLVVVGPGLVPTLWDLPPRKPWGRIIAWWVLLGVALAAVGSVPRRRTKDGSLHA